MRPNIRNIFRNNREVSHNKVPRTYQFIAAGFPNPSTKIWAMLVFQGAQELCVLHQGLGHQMVIHSLASARTPWGVLWRPEGLLKHLKIIKNPTKHEIFFSGNMKTFPLIWCMECWSVDPLPCRFWFQNGS